MGPRGPPGRGAALLVRRHDLARVQAQKGAVVAQETPGIYIAWERGKVVVFDGRQVFDADARFLGGGGERQPAGFARLA